LIAFDADWGSGVSQGNESKLEEAPNRKLIVAYLSYALQDVRALSDIAVASSAYGDCFARWGKATSKFRGGSRSGLCVIEPGSVGHLDNIIGVPS